MTPREEIALLRLILVHFWVSQFLPLFMRKWLHTNNSVGNKIHHEVRRSYKKLNYPPIIAHTNSMIVAHKVIMQLMHTAMFLPDKQEASEPPYIVSRVSRKFMLKAARKRKRELQDYIERQSIGQEPEIRRC